MLILQNLILIFSLIAIHLSYIVRIPFNKIYSLK